MPEKLKVGTRGVALEDILPAAKGIAWFKVQGELECLAITEVRAGAEVIVVDGHRGIREASPYELKFERYVGLAGQTRLFFRATEENRYPVADSGVKDDFARIATGAAQVAYVVGTNAFAADSGVPWGQTFTATILTVLCNQNAWIRFNGDSRVLHYIPANIPTDFPLKITQFWIVQDALAGVADIWMFG